MLEGTITVKVLIPLACALFAFAFVAKAGDPVAQWNVLMLKAIKNENTSPPLAACTPAIPHAAIHDVINAIVPTCKQGPIDNAAGNPAQTATNVVVPVNVVVTINAWTR